MGMFNSSISGALVFSMQDNQLSGALRRQLCVWGVMHCTIGRAACPGASHPLCLRLLSRSHCAGELPAFLEEQNLPPGNSLTVRLLGNDNFTSANCSQYSYSSIPCNSPGGCRAPNRLIWSGCCSCHY